MKTLVLGGTGFVGCNMVKTLRKAGIDTASASRAEGTDLRDVEQARRLFAETAPDIVVNCAAHVGSLNYVTQYAADVVTDNLRLLLGIYEGLQKECPKAVLINPIANCAYPATGDTFEEDQWWNGHLHRSVLSYGSTRRMMWCLGECFQMQHQLRSIHFLVPNMYGPNDSTDPNKTHALNALVCKFVKADVEGQEEITIWGTGVAVREWLYAGDFARVVLEVIQRPNLAAELNEPINIGQKFGLSVRELVDLITGHMKFKGRTVYDHNMPDGAPRKVMDDRRFRKVFPDFEFTSLADGIEETIRYYKSILNPDV